MVEITALTSFLNELQLFVLQNPDALQLYRQYLSLSSHPTLVNHIDFYQDVDNLENNENNNKNNQNNAQNNLEDNGNTCTDIYNKYFSRTNSTGTLLDIKEEIIKYVGENIYTLGSAAFRPALHAVIKDLCFENLTNFTNSDMFQEYKVYLKVAASNQEMLNLPPKQRNSTVRLRKFFGEQINSNEASRLSYRSQPRHVKSFKLNKKFGERVIVEHNETIENEGGESPRLRASRESVRRSRRLHMFFGDPFVVDDVLFSEKIRAPFDAVESSAAVSDDLDKINKQPDHVHPHRLNRFFGERLNKEAPPTIKQESGDSDDLSGEQAMTMVDDEPEITTTTSATTTTTTPTSLTLPSDETDASSSFSTRLRKNYRIMRFFGERIDPLIEAAHKLFVDQPAHVRPMKLKKFFGTSDAAAASTNQNEQSTGGYDNDDERGPTKKAKRAHKLHKFFGIKVNEAGEVDPTPDQDHVVPVTVE